MSRPRQVTPTSTRFSDSACWLASCGSLIDFDFDLNPHIHRIALALQLRHFGDTTRVSHRPIKRQSRSWSHGGRKVNRSHHGDNPLLRSTAIQIATKPLPGPTNREHRKLLSASRRRCLWVRTIVSTIWSAAGVSEFELRATEKTV